MADLNVNLRVGAQVKDAEDGLNRLRQGLNRLNSVRLQNAGRQLTQFGNRVSSVGRQLSLFVTGPLALLGGSTLNAFDRQAQAIAQLEQGIRSTGAAAGFTAEQLRRTASELQSVTTFGDEDILTGVTNQLLTFTNIAGDQFIRTQEAALDLATRLGGDLQSAAIQLGKALNDPVANLSALSRSGIQFSEDQKELINSLVETNRLADAQNIILSELEKQYGGSARAAAEAGLGPLKQFRNALGDIAEEIGSALAPALNSAARFLTGLLNRFLSLDAGTRRFAIAIGVAVAAIGPLLVALGSLVSIVGIAVTGLGALGTIFAAITSPITLTIAAIAGLAAGLAILVQRFFILRDAGVGVFDSLKVIALDVAETINDVLVGSFEAFINTAIAGANLIRQAFGQELIPPLQLDGFGEEIAGLRQQVLDEVQVQESDLPNAFDVIKDKIQTALADGFSSVKDAVGFVIPEVDALRIKTDELAESAEKVNKPVSEFSKKLSEVKVPSPAEIGVTAATQAANGLAGAFTKIGEGTKSASEAFSDFAKNFLQQIGEMIVQAAILRGIQSAIGGGAGGTGTAGAGANSSGGFIKGGQNVSRFAEGGQVVGPGSGTSDSIPAMLSNGEFVNDARTVAFHGVDLFKNLKRMARQGLSVQQPSFAGASRFADGGFVGGNGSDFVTSSQGGTAQNMTVEVINNGRNQTEVTNVERSRGARGEILKIFIDDLKVNGPASKALAGSFNLKRRGFK